MTKRRWLAAGLLLLAVNSSWLVAFPAASLIYVGNVLAHIGIGLALVALLASSRNVVRELWSQGGRGALTAFGVAALTGGALRRRCDTRESQSHGGARRRRVRRHSAHPVGVAAELSVIRPLGRRRAGDRRSAARGRASTPTGRADCRNRAHPQSGHGAPDDGGRGRRAAQPVLPIRIHHQRRRADSIRVLPRLEGLRLRIARLRLRARPWLS